MAALAPLIPLLTLAGSEAAKKGIPLLMEKAVIPGVTKLGNLLVSKFSKKNKSPAKLMESFEKPIKDFAESDLVKHVFPEAFKADAPPVKPPRRRRPAQTAIKDGRKGQMINLKIKVGYHDTLSKLGKNEDNLVPYIQ